MKWAPGLDPFNPPSSSYTRERIFRSRYRQAVPYNTALPYSFEYQVVNKFPSNGTSHRFPEYDALNSTGFPGIKGQLSDPTLANYAVQKARDRFREAMGDAASWGVNLAERRQAMSMMTQRLTSMVGFVRKLKRFDWYGALRELILNNDSEPKVQRRKRYLQAQLRVNSLIKDGRLKKQAKYFADNYLEFHFGWSPAVSDIYSTIDILQQEIAPNHIRVSAKSDKTERLSAGNTLYKGRDKVKIGATVMISNPNLWLANQLGVVNPAVVAFELIPFSFILDWFVNVSEFLGSFTEHAGMSITDAYWTHSHTESREWEAIGSIDIWTGNPAYVVSGSNASFSVYRYLGLPPGPDIQIRKPWALSPRRGAAAASLLVQMLK